MEEMPLDRMMKIILRQIDCVAHSPPEPDRQVRQAPFGIFDRAADALEIERQHASNVARAKRRTGELAESRMPARADAARPPSVRIPQMAARASPAWT